MQQAPTLWNGGIGTADVPMEPERELIAPGRAQANPDQSLSTPGLQEQPIALRDEHPTPAAARTPETFILAIEVEATAQDRVLLATLGIRRNGAGSLPALRTATRAADAAAAIHPSKRAQEWVAICRSLVDRVALVAKQATWLETPCPVTDGRLVADALGNPARCILPADARRHLDAWLGLHFFHALSRGCALSLSILDDWDTLRRTGAPRSNTPIAWIGLARHMPLDAAAITRLLPAVKSNRLKDALTTTLAALAADIPDPASLTASEADVHDEPSVISTLDLAGTSEVLDPEGDDDADEDRDDIDVEDEVAHEGDQNSLVGLLLHRALHEGYRGHFGVTGIYGELPSPNLQQTCHALASTLATGTELDRTRAAVAEVSLKVSLSPRRALSLALQPNNDVWLDLAIGAICWNFDRVRDKRDRDDADALAGCSANPILIRLSDRTVARLRELHCQQPGAGSLRELVNVAADKVVLRKWLEAYGHFLRSHGDTNYKAYSVRFARSYRSVYLDRGHGAIASAFLGMDFCTVPPGLLHYISVPLSRLTAWQLDVDTYLGLHWTAPTLEGR
jgi:hypothetical protein